MLSISFGVGSKECDSAPGFMRSSISALSPAIALAKSYAGKSVHTMLSLSGSGSVSAAVQAHSSGSSSAAARSPASVILIVLHILHTFRTAY